MDSICTSFAVSLLNYSQVNSFAPEYYRLGKCKLVSYKKMRILPEIIKKLRNSHQDLSFLVP